MSQMQREPNKSLCNWGGGSSADRASIANDFGHWKVSGLNPFSLTNVIDSMNRLIGKPKTENQLSSQIY